MKGGAGNAQPEDVVSGKTFTNDDGEKVGTRVSYAVGNSVDYTKLRLQLPPNRFDSPTPTETGNTMAGSHSCLAKDGSGYYVSYFETRIFKTFIEKYDNFGVRIWSKVLDSMSSSAYGVPIAGTSDGGVMAYLGKTPSYSWCVFIKLLSDGTYVTREDSILIMKDMCISMMV